MKKIVLLCLSILLIMSLVACGETNSTEEEETTTEMRPDIDQTYEITIEDLIIKENDKEIYGKIYTPDAEGTFPTIIMCHGYNGCHADFVNECKYYAQHGYVAYSFDFSGGSGRSKSKGKSTDMTIFTEKDDLITVFNYIKTLDNVNKDRIFLFGGSQGGLVAAMAAEELVDEVKALVTYFPAFNIPDNWRHNYPTIDAIPEVVDFWGLKLGKNFFASMHDYYTFENIGKFDKDVLIIQGDKDPIVPLVTAKLAVNTYPSAELVIINGEAHGFTPAAGKQAMEKVLEFMRNHY